MYHVTGSKPEYRLLAKSVKFPVQLKKKKKKPLVFVYPSVISTRRSKKTLMRCVCSAGSQQKASSNNGSKVTSERVAIITLSVLLTCAAVALVFICEFKQLFQMYSTWIFHSVWILFCFISAWQSFRKITEMNSHKIHKIVM